MGRPPSARLGLFGHLLAAIALVFAAGCDTPPRPSVVPSAEVSAPSSSRLPAPAPVVAQPSDVVAEGLREVDGWASAGFPPNDERVVPASVGRRCYHCYRAWFRAAVEQPDAFAHALASRKALVVISVTARDVLTEYGGVAAVSFVRALDFDEARWEEAARTLAETYDFGFTPLLVHELRRHLAAHPDDQGATAAALVLVAKLKDGPCQRRGVMCEGVEWRHPDRLLRRRVTEIDLTHLLERADGWHFSTALCPAFGAEPSLVSRLVATTREHARRETADLRQGAVSVDGCLCARKAAAARTELGRFFRARAADPMSVDAELAVEFEGTCR